MTLAQTRMTALWPITFIHRLPCPRRHRALLHHLRRLILERGHRLAAPVPREERLLLARLGSETERRPDCRFDQPFAQCPMKSDCRASATSLGDQLGSPNRRWE